MTTLLARPVRGVSVRSRKSPGNCAPDWGYAVVDFEPIPASEPSSVEFACPPCHDTELNDALAMLDEFPGGVALFGTEDRELLDEIDEAFYERVRFVHPLPDDDIPPGLPDSHWWWRLPEKAR